LARLKALGLDSDSKALAALMADIDTTATTSSSSSASAEPASEVLKAHVPLPSVEDVERLVVEKKRKELLAKYGALEPSSGDNDTLMTASK